MPRKLAAAVFAAVFAVGAGVAVFAVGAGVAVHTLAPASPHLAAGASAIGAAAPVRIMALGDSITYGLGSQTRSSYRVDLQQRLALAGLAVDFVGSRQSGAGVDLDNEGHGGWTIRQIAARVDGWLATYQPDVVLLHIGTNDLAFDDDVAHAPERLSALVDRIRAARPSAEIFVQKIVGSRKPWLQSASTPST